MNKPQDSVSNVQADSGETQEHVPQNKISSTEKDALGESALDDVSGGTIIAGPMPVGPGG